MIKKAPKPIEAPRNNTVDPKILKEFYRWGIFKSDVGKVVNIYFSAMVYPSMIKGGFLTKEEAEKCL